MNKHKLEPARIRLTLNGENFTTSSATVGEFLTEHNLSGKRIAVELNREVIARTRYADTPIEDGDTIEIVQFVGGG